METICFLILIGCLPHPLRLRLFWKVAGKKGTGKLSVGGKAARAIEKTKEFSGGVTPKAICPSLFVGQSNLPK